MNSYAVYFSMNSGSSLGHPIITENSHANQQRHENSITRLQLGQSLTNASAEKNETPPSKAASACHLFRNKIRGKLTFDDQVWITHGLFVLSAYLSLGLPLDQVQQMGLFYGLMGLGIAPVFVPALTITARELVWRVKRFGGGRR